MQLSRQTYHWLGHAQLLGQSLPADQLTSIFAVEKVSHKSPDGARVGGRAEREQQEREVECCSVPLAEYSLHVLSSDGGWDKRFCTAADAPRGGWGKAPRRSCAEWAQQAAGTAERAALVRGTLFWGLMP